MFQMDIHKTPQIYKCSIASRIEIGRQVSSNPTDCKKYNKNVKFLWNLFYSYNFHHTILSVFLQWMSRNLNFIFGIIYFKKHCLCICQFWQYLENIAYVIFCADIARLLQNFNNISNRFRNVLKILQYFQGIFEIIRRSLKMKNRQKYLELYFRNASETLLFFLFCSFYFCSQPKEIVAMAIKYSKYFCNVFEILCAMWVALAGTSFKSVICDSRIPIGYPMRRCKN